MAFSILSTPNELNLSFKVIQLSTKTINYIDSREVKRQLDSTM